MKKFGMGFFIVNSLIAYFLAFLVYTEIIPVSKEGVTLLFIVVGLCFFSFSANVVEDK
ncbi:hypothetical protein [Bacillus cereus group sp. BfR-BA-01700]|uniref:hypothetical protein n=1 Tax=Bacillus cereus group sp. BfR-BA-01700 TaxID=3094884 RepID=UPI0029C4C9B1|nr:hypothetical protein [Bacillus cereus group sp. BfR-BA-01700]MDX5841050.1 hypothetical protein [Bacillus cereus group sp. BfR-BA-01700]HDR7242583.1 hypothetical protein [Bacillus mobilis]